ncbi:xanthine dehydrogenase family protein subunit M, partial [Deinococcus sp. 6GRE01]|nr:xanthine dehydrogenase family protein subunit M [Deinococcus sp. 6GRE01]
GLVEAGDLLGDRFASAEYRAHLVDVLAARALERLG